MSKSILLCVLIYFICLSCQATHLRAGEISFKRVSETSFTYEITVLVYTDNGPTNPVLFGDGELRFGDEEDPDSFYSLPRDIQNNTHVFYLDGRLTSQPFNEDLEPNVAKAAFTIRHTYDQEGRFVISYNEPNRNGGIVNIEKGNSINTKFYTESSLYATDLISEVNSSPIPIVPAVFSQVINEKWSISLAHIDSNDYKLRYFLSVPKKDRNTPVSNYILPSQVDLNPVTGLFTWDVKNDPDAQVGEFVFSVAIVQYEILNGDFEEVGYVINDFQVILQDGNIFIGSIASEDSDQILIENNDKEIKIFSNSEGNQISYELFSELERNIDYSFYQSNDSLFITIFQDLTPRINPYQLVVRTKVSNSDIYRFVDRVYLVYTTEILEPDLEYKLITSTDIAKKNLYDIYPNPAKTFISINNNIFDKEALIYDQSGNFISKKEINRNGVIEISDLKDGVYFIYVDNRSFRIIKQQ